jgi:hypothetical protein
MEDYNNHDPSLTQPLVHKKSMKIDHPNVRSLRYKKNELLCHLNHDPPHILCVTEHHLHHEELAFLHRVLCISVLLLQEMKTQSWCLCICT